MNNKIAFIVPYYGELPSYFPLFICSIQNKPFHLYVFSDLDEPEKLPSNVFWEKKTFEMFLELAMVRLNIQISFKKKYKICDFKPAYGLIFEHYLKGYDFWGSIDIDTIVGRFENFLSDTTLDSIDIYSGIKEYISGSFFLIRNTEYCNTLFQKSKDWKYVFESLEYLYFDECGGHYFKELKNGKSIFNLNTPIQSFTEVVFIESKKGLRVLFKNEILEPKGITPIMIEDNSIIFLKDEYLLIHFIYYKMKYYFYIKHEVLPPPYYISEFGTFKKRPRFFNIILSKNFWKGRFLKKIEINLNKLRFFSFLN